MKYETIRWNHNHVELIDQRLLPGRLKYINCATAKDIWNAIKSMKIRGAPAIGIAGAFGMYLGIRKSKAVKFNAFEKELDKVRAYLAGSRPTARNLFWALERICFMVERNKDRTIDKLKELILEESRNILKEDNVLCRLIGHYGKDLIPKGSNILTHCNAGGLATGSYGTALGVIFSASKKIEMVYVDETRPVLQGARLTAWELIARKVPATLICDNMAASLMAKGSIDIVIVGADRIAANGDVANKIGTYNLAVLAEYHKIPFYVAAPFSTFDKSIPDGNAIPIEVRSPVEVRKIGKELITVKDIKVYNPAFDVTPASLITAIITECGVISGPDEKKLAKFACKVPRRGLIRVKKNPR